MSFNQHVAAMLSHMIAKPDFASQEGLGEALRLLAKWRSKLIDNTVVAHHGTVVQNGPFRGMTFVAEASECNVSPRLLGSYEGELHSIIDAITSVEYDSLIDIGCADGYYAVGFARRIPNLKVFAFDISPVAQKKCKDLAICNGVENRFSVGGEFKGEDFAAYTDCRALVFIDAEGVEDDLLRPDLFPALLKLSILVECHDVFKPGLSHRIAERFNGTHIIHRVEPHLNRPILPDWLKQASHLDQLLAAWEWRMGPTPWLYMTPRVA